MNEKKAGKILVDHSTGGNVQPLPIDYYRGVVWYLCWILSRLEQTLPYTISITITTILLSITYFLRFKKTIVIIKKKDQLW